MDTRFPGLAWMPRWTRKYLTPQTAFGIALGLFSAGSWVGTYLTAPDVRALTKSVGEIQYVMGPHCERDCVLKTNDIKDLTSHVNDLWEMRADIDAELARQEAQKKIEAALRAAAAESQKPQQNAPPEARKGKVKPR